MSSQNQSQTVAPLFSVIIPVYNGGEMLSHCLRALHQSQLQDWELIVVDDCSTDQSVAIARHFGAKVLSTLRRGGPSAARNLGVQSAEGKYLCFIDADCEPHPDTLSHFQIALSQHPEIDAMFGSYDNAPKSQTFVAQFKNLMHHYVHQAGQEEASTFWSGCGVIKRSSFIELGGFDVEQYSRPCIEDIELGYRLRQAGGKIHLVKQAQVKHHKAWTLWNLIKTDVCDRGIPWTRLLLSYPSGLMNDLNLKVSDRISVLAVYLLSICLPLALYHSGFVLLALGLMGLLLILNLDLYTFFYQQRGPLFTLGSIWMHWLYYLYSGFAFGYGSLLHWLDVLKPKSIPTKLFASR
jgi:glycosyltransferase involved in cell wall biosynthesis